MDKDDAGYRIVVNKIATGAAHEQSDDQYFKTADGYDTLRPSVLRAMGLRFPV